MKGFELANLNQVSDYVWEIPKTYRADMAVPARVFATRKMLEKIAQDASLTQLVNSTTLPGIYKYALAMTDVHEGYGLPVGGVVATDPAQGGVISPGSIGYDIGCGVRLLRTGLKADNISANLAHLAQKLFSLIPSGVGRGGKIKLKGKAMDELLVGGVDWVIKQGYGKPGDAEKIEERGTIAGADPSKVSPRAKGRGADQLGTMGSGNHFVEIQKVETIFDTATASQWGLVQGEVTVLIHCGSRGLGHQICSDYVKVALGKMPQYTIKLPDNQLAAVPIDSPEGKDYQAAMHCAINFAYANRQVITHLVREVFPSAEIVYDVAHNIGKLEEYEGKKLMVHRKGATRAWPGQPVLIPGSMGTASFVLVGSEGSMTQSFGSACHGAGRMMSRSQAKRQIEGKKLQQELAEQGIMIVSDSYRGIAEEAPTAYKDVDEVVDVVHQLDLAKKVARLKPMAVIKGG